MGLILYLKGFFMKYLFFSLLLVFPLLATPLTLKEGFVAAHTEVLGDSTIDPLNIGLKAEMSMDSTLESLKGNFSVNMNFFSSDNEDRDENMHESTEAETFPISTYTIETVTKAEGENNYLMTGKLNFHGIDKKLNFDVEITQDTKSVSIKGKSKILVSDYGIDMPCLGGFFLCVDDNVDLFVKAVLSK